MNLIKISPQKLTLVGLIVFFFSSCSTSENKTPIQDVADKTLSDSVASHGINSTINQGLNTPDLTGTIKDTTAIPWYLNKADDAMKNGNFQKAIDFAKKGEEIVLQFYPEDHLYLADFWHHQGRGYNGLHHFESSNTFYQKALILREKVLPSNDYRLSESYFGLGNLASFMDNIELSKQYHEQAVEVYNLNGEKCKSRLGDILQALATSYRNHHDEKHKIEPTLLKAIETYHCSADYPIAHLANAYFDLAWYYDNIQLNITKSIKVRKKGISMILSEGDHSNPYLYNGYLGLGDSYEKQGLHEEAIRYLKKALMIIENKYGTESAYAIRIYRELGKNYSLIKQFSKAENNYLKALSITLKYYQPDNNNVINIYNRLAGFYDYWEINNKAKAYIEKSLSTIKPTDPPSVAKAYTYQNYANTLMKNKAYEEAILYANKSLDVKLDYYQEENQWVSTSYSQLGKIYKAKNDLNLAKTYFLKALNNTTRLRGDDYPDLDEIRKHLSEINIAQDSLELALNQINKALKLNRYTDLSTLENAVSLVSIINTLYKRCQVLEKLYDQNNDINYLKKAYSTLVEMNTIKMYRSHKVIDGNTDDFDMLTCNCTDEISISILKKYYKATGNTILLKEMFANLEQGKGVILRQASMQSNTEFSGLADEQLRLREFNLKNKIEELEKERFSDSYQFKGAVKDSVYLSYTKDLITLQQQFDRLVDSISSISPDYYNLKFSNHTISLSGVQDSLLNSNNALLEYFVGESSIFAFVITKDTFGVQEIKMDFPLDQWVSQMRCGLLPAQVRDTSECGMMSDQEAQALYVKTAQDIYQKIFTPIESLISGKKELILVPDGILGYVPFDALITKAATKPADFHLHEYLIKDYQISYAYSATLLQKMRYHQHEQKTPQSFIAYAPVFDTSKEVPSDSLLIAYNIPKTNYIRNATGPLKFNISEVEDIQSLIGGTIYTDTSASLQQFLATASNAQILHLSTHGKANDKVGDYSFLAFYQASDSSITSSRLYNRDLYNLNLNADMVVLSACETGIGELQKGEGIISLARGFSYAGAKSIVTTLWSVDDEGSSKLMNQFYRFLHSGLSKDAALQQAKIELMKNPKYASPYFWAAAIPIGDMTAINLSSGFSWYWVLLLFIPLFIIGLRKIIKT